MVLLKALLCLLECLLSDPSLAGAVLTYQKRIRFPHQAFNLVFYIFKCIKKKMKENYCPGSGNLKINQLD